MRDLIEINKKNKEKTLEADIGTIEMMLPSITFDVAELPEIVKWAKNIKKKPTYLLTIKVIMDNFNDSKSLKFEERTNARFDVIGVEVNKEKKKENNPKKDY